jgi:hypothetical protein
MQHNILVAFSVFRPSRKGEIVVYDIVEIPLLKPTCGASRLLAIVGGVVGEICAVDVLQARYNLETFFFVSCVFSDSSIGSAVFIQIDLSIGCCRK